MVLNSTYFFNEKSLALIPYHPNSKLQNHTERHTPVLPTRRNISVFPPWSVRTDTRRPPHHSIDCQLGSYTATPVQPSHYTQTMPYRQDAGSHPSASGTDWVPEKSA
ncbi:hypothetical protein HBI44_170970 [Parastagonospora nodorum]|nr:hypothetical protein HBI44_170970 [Parastagonospora nodorum]